MKILAVLFLFLFGVNTDEIKIKIKEIPVDQAISGDRINLIAFGFGNGRSMDSAIGKAHAMASANLQNMVTGSDFTLSSGNTMRTEGEAVLKDVDTILQTVISTNPFNVLIGLSMPGKPIKKESTRQGAFTASFTLNDPDRFSFDLEQSTVRATQMYLESKKVTDTEGTYFIQDINLVKHKKKDQFKVDLTIVMTY